MGSCCGAIGRRCGRRATLPPSSRRNGSRSWAKTSSSIAAATANSDASPSFARIAAVRSTTAFSRAAPSAAPITAGSSTAPELASISPTNRQAARTKTRRQRAYPVQELGGLLFVYMGPLPAPLLPRWDTLVRKDGTRLIEIRPTLTCNWLQAQENTADTTHTYYLHGHMMAQKGITWESAAYYYRPIVSYDFELCEWGITKTLVYGGDKPEEEIRPPLIFPNILRIPEGRNERQHWRVPIDDTSTRIVVMQFEPNATGEDQPPQTSCRCSTCPTIRDPTASTRSTISIAKTAWRGKRQVRDVRPQRGSTCP